MEKYYGLKTILENGEFIEKIILLGEFEDFDEVDETTIAEDCTWIFGEESLHLLVNEITKTINKYSLINGTHMYFGLDIENNELHLLGTMESISEADEVTDAINAPISGIYSTESLLKLNKQLNSLLG